jgi:hypothetical protein
VRPGANVNGRVVRDLDRRRVRAPTGEPDSNPVPPSSGWTPAAASGTVHHLMAVKRLFANRTLVPAAAGMRGFAVGRPSTETLIDQPRGH